MKTVRRENRHALAAQALGLAVIAVLVAACGGHGAPRYGGSAISTSGCLTGVMPTGPIHFDLDCSICHSDGVDPGTEQPGTNALPRCNLAACHHHETAAGVPAQAVHRPAGPGSACIDCHTAHVSSNLCLVRNAILTPPGDERTVELTTLAGLADGGLASVTPPVRGVCQVCHTATRFYRSDGSGEPHFTYPCFTCHPHGQGFAPQPSPAATPTLSPP